MKLHQQYFQKKIAQAVAPLLSRVILLIGITDLIRKLIAYLNYILGMGAGTGHAIEVEVSVAIKCIKRENPVVLDVGANVGSWSQLYRKYNTNGILYMFEPQISCQQSILNKNIPNAQLIRAAVGSEKKKLKLFASSLADGSASLHKRKDSFFEDRSYSEQIVDVVSLDQFIDEQKIEFVDFIKLDIEGHEFEALRGLEKSISALKIGAFSFEFGSGNLNSRTCFRDFWETLNKSHDLFIITPSGKLNRICGYYEDLEYYRGVSNFVALQKNQA